jgi:hypothetical protein
MTAPPLECHVPTQQPHPEGRYGRVEWNGAKPRQWAPEPCTAYNQVDPSVHRLHAPAVYRYQALYQIPTSPLNDAAIL